MSSERAAVIVDAIRSPFGRRGGVLAGWHPVDLAAELLSQLVARNGLDGSVVDDVVLGCTSQVGAQACNIARRAALAAGWPEAVGGTTVDRQAVSSAQAVHWAAQAVIAGAQDVAVAGGIEVMTAVPLGASLAVPAVGKPFGDRLQARYRDGGGLVPPGLAAEEVARRWSLRRADLDAWAYESHARARAARSHTSSYLMRLPSGHKSPGRRGQGPRAGPAVDEALALRPSRAGIKALSPIYVDGGLITAANMAADGDGAAAVLVASPGRARQLGVGAKARLAAFASTGVAPEIWPVGSAPAAREAVRRAGVDWQDIGRFEVHESSSAAVLAWLAETGVPPERVNPEGGALAITAPLGAAGAGLFAAAVAGLVASHDRYALVAISGEGGVASACVLERA